MAETLAKNSDSDLRVLTWLVTSFKIYVLIPYIGIKMA